MTLSTFMSAVGWLVPNVTSAQPRDTDRDGLPNALERETGTDPHHADTDRDGLDDGHEDANRDGDVDPGESNPRVAGLHPGAYPHIPEPMVFDLVRGLGAEQGELEANVLAVAQPSTTAGWSVAWAPEVEWAFADLWAVELELPMQELEVEAAKLALQNTFPLRTDAFIHGWQLIGEKFVHEQGGLSTLLYLAGARLTRSVSLLMMLGGEAMLTDGWELTGIVNPSLFLDVTETLTVGLETNVRLTRTPEVLLMPQAHWQLGRHFRLQAGGGAVYTGTDWLPAFSARAVVE